MRTRTLVYLLLATGLLATTSLPAAEVTRQRWLYLQMNLQVEANVAKVQEILRRAAAAGYNGVVLADYKLNILDRVPEHYFRHAAQVKQTANELKLELIPTVCGIGYSDGLLAHDPNLAEGIPVKDAPLSVRKGRATPAGEAVNLLPGGSFDELKGKGPAAAGWGYQDFPGQASFLDSEVKHAGASSLRFEDLSRTAKPSGNGRVSRQVEVEPWRQFHASVWIRTEEFAPAAGVRLFAIGADGRTLSHSNLGVKSTQDWTEHHVVFNSLDNRQVTLYCGAWGGRSGKLWLDDARLEETAFINLLRRPACPLVVADADGQPYEEGRDFAELRDPLLGNVPYAGSFNAYHQPPVLRLLPGSRIKEGQRLKVSFSHTVTIYDNQVACCLADPGVFAVLEDQVARVRKLLEPKTYFLSHDEIRVANWCAACRQEGRTAGQLLAENVRRCAALVRKVDPQARLCVWSDMFDPHHNAHDKFYLVNGDLAGSWEGLPSDTILINWNSGKPRDSLPFFGRRGHTQVLAGYYDHQPAAIADWLKAGGQDSGVTGAMYTTWKNDFSQLEAFARHAWGGGNEK